MNQRPPTPDDQQLYKLVRLYDEVVANGAGPESLHESVSGLRREMAAEFDHLRQCVELLESARRTRDSRMGGEESASGDGAEPRRLALPRNIGRFELHSEIGRGGCGVVFRARDPRVDRDVAIKVPRPETLMIDELRQRFLHEARAAGNLDHPNVVPIFEVGEDGPICYIAAAYVEGPSLAAWLRGRQDTVDARQAATLVATLAGAVEQAHDRGVIHRDIKPGNVLLQPVEPGRESSNLSAYTPKLTDFGLAKLRESNQVATRSGMLIGTPAYMAPEQAEGRLALIGPATDVYALGAILYELLTGQPPLRGESEVDTLRRIVSDEPPLVRLARPGVSRDIEAICLKCLEKRPAQRYESAAALAADLRRFLDGQATCARPIGSMRRLVRWSRRRPAVAALVFVSVLSLAALAAGSLIYSARLADALQTADLERTRAESESRTSRQLLYSAEVRLAYDAWRSLNRTRAIQLLARHLPADGQGDLREFAWHWLWGQCHAELRSFKGHSDEVFGVSYSPDGTMLASASKDGTARLWDVATGQVRHVLAGHTDEVTCLAFSPDGTRLATGSEDRRVILWEVSTGTSLDTFAGHENHVLAVAFSPDGRQLASGGRDKCVRLWDLDARQPRRVLTEPAQVVRCIRYAPDGRVLAACDEGGAVHRWETSDWKSLAPTLKTSGSLFAIDFDPDSRRLIAAGRDCILHCWDLEQLRLVSFSSLENHGSWIRDARLSPDGATAATCNHNGFLRLWDIRGSDSQDDDALLAAVPAHAGRVWGVAWSPDGKRLASAGGDRLVKVWDVAKHIETSPFEQISGWVWNVAFTADSKTMVTVHRGSVVSSWNVESGTLVDSHRQSHDWSRISLAIDRTGEHAALSSPMATTVRYLNLKSGKVLFEDGGHRGGVNALDISRDGRLLAVAGENNAATILELPRGTRRRELPHESFVSAVDFSPDGRTVVTASRELRLWDVRSGALLWAKRHHEANPRCAIFSPDGKTIAAAVGGDNVALVNAASGELQGSLLSEQDDPTALAFSPDGETLAVGVGPRAAVNLWDVRTHQELCLLDADVAAIFAVAFSPDGQRLVASGQAPGQQAHPQGTGRIVEWVLPAVTPAE